MPALHYYQLKDTVVEVLWGEGGGGGNLQILGKAESWVLVWFSKSHYEQQLSQLFMLIY